MIRKFVNFVKNRPALQNIFLSLGVRIPLTTYERTPDLGAGFHSQYGQDHWVVEWVFHGRTKPGFFIEMGAGDGILLSNTYVLEKKYGWTGILIEPTSKFKKLKENRTAYCVNSCISSKGGSSYIACIPGPGYLDQDANNTLRSMIIDAESLKEAEINAVKYLPKDIRGKVAEGDIIVKEIECETIDSVLKNANAPKEIDYLSLDVEGHEYEIMSVFPFDKHKVLCMNIERPNEKLKNLLKKEKYIPVAKNSCGDIFYIHETMKATYFSNAR